MCRQGKTQKFILVHATTKAIFSPFTTKIIVFSGGYIWCF